MGKKVKVSITSETVHFVLDLPTEEAMEKALARGEIEVDEEWLAQQNSNEAESKKETEQSSFITAQEILDQDFIGPEQIEQVFDIELNPETIPPIPFSQQELETAKQLNQFLILRINQDNQGNRLTMKRMNEILQPEFNNQDKGKILCNTDWYKNESFFTKETPNKNWALVSKELIPNTTSKNYLEQTVVLAEYLQEQIFGKQDIPNIYQEALEEFDEEKQEEIQELMNKDWKRAAETLSNLKLNQLTRSTPSETLFDLLTYFEITNHRLLENRYNWTSERSSDGGLVNVGGFDADGLRVYGWLPDYRYVAFGAFLSRSL